VVIPSRVRDSEAHDHFIEKRRIGYFDARAAKIVACVKRKLIHSWFNAFTGEQRVVGAAILIRGHGLQVPAFAVPQSV
jgi:hypothetical protein